MSKHEVIERKTRVARESYQARAITPSKALRLAMSKAAEDLFEMALSVEAMEYLEVEHGTLADTLGETGLLMVLDGPHGLRGACTMDAGLIAALIEAQTTGAVSAAAPDDRRLTRTDAAMAAPIIDMVLAQATQLLGPEGEGRLTRGYTFGAMEEEMRTLLLTLDRPDYHVFHAVLDLGKGAKQGKWSLVLPVVDLAEQAKADQAAEAAAEAETAGETTATRPTVSMERAVMAAPVVMDAVLARQKLPLDRAMNLKPGDLIEISPEHLGRTEFVVPGGHVVARGKLGQMNGARAVRLHLPGAALGRELQAAVTGAAFEDHEGVSGGGMSHAPDVPMLDMGAAADFDLAADLPDLPDLPDMGDLPDVGDLPDLPDLPDMGDFPDLPDLPDLPDIGDLPDLPDLP